MLVLMHRLNLFLNISHGIFTSSSNAIRHYCGVSRAPYQADKAFVESESSADQPTGWELFNVNH